MEINGGVVDMSRPKGSKDNKKRKTRKILSAKEERIIVDSWLERSIKSLAEEFNVSQGAIIGVAKRHGLPKKTNISFKRKKLEDLAGICGVYFLTTSNGMHYIGSSMDVGKRISTHLCSVIEKSHFNKSLQDSWDADSWFGLIEECSDDKLLEREAYFIKHTANLHNSWNIKEIDRETLKYFVDRINKKINITADGCWEYVGKVNKSGYGEVHLKKNLNRKKSINTYTHRVMYFWANPDENMSQIVRHLCNSKNCCNPEHLTVGTYRDNLLDIKRDEMILFEKRFVETNYDRAVLMKEFNLKPGGVYSRIYSLKLFEKYPHLKRRNH